MGNVSHLSLPNRRTRANCRKALPTAKNDLASTALQYHARGWTLLPVVGQVPPRGCPYKDRWCKQRQTAAEVRELFADRRVTGIAVLLGRRSRDLIARDYDDADAYCHWAAEHPDLATSLPTVRTRRGYHIYFRGDFKGVQHLGDGEMRGDGNAYCVLPPSLHPEGVTYRWTVPLPKGRLPLVDPLDTGLLPWPGTVTDAQKTQDTQTHIACVRQGDLEAIISSTLPTGPGQRNRRLFDLARALKAIMPDAPRSELWLMLEVWHRRALPVIRTKDFTTTWSDFTIAWERVKVPLGGELGRVVARTKASPLPKAAQAYDLLAMQYLVALCAELQAHHGPGKSWPLSCRIAGKHIGVSHDTAARFLKLLCADGVLNLAQPAGPKGSRRAAEYRYVPQTS